MASNFIPRDLTDLNVSNFMSYDLTIFIAIHHYVYLWYLWYHVLYNFNMYPALC